MRLFGVEMTRFRSRRAIVLMLIGATLLTALVTVTTLLETMPVSEAEMDRASALAEREAGRRYIEDELAQCREDPTGWLGPDGTAEECEELIVPQPEWFLTRSVLDLEEQSKSSGIAVIVLLTGILMVVGATFAGADWASGSVSNQVLFEPRRARVWLAKAAAVVAGTLAAATAVLGVFWLVLFLVADSRGISTGAAVQESIRWGTARGIALATAAALGAYALTMLLRHTVGTLALLFGYAVGGEILLSTLPFEGLARWSLSNNVFAWLFDGHDYFDPGITCPITEDACDQTVHLTMWDGGWFLAALVLVVSLLSLMFFRRRDIP